MYNLTLVKQFNTIDEYIDSFPTEVQSLLRVVRRTIKESAPEATEKISYGMPTFYLNGNLIHFAAHKTHIGLYPGSAPISVFSKDLEPYETSKGTVKLPFDKPLPLALISKIVHYCVKEHLARNK